MVGTEMLYYLVGSRELDGGLMCTASHNPKPYTGAKLVEPRRAGAVGRRRAGRGPRPDPRRARRRARWRFGSGGRRLRRLPAGGAEAGRPVRDQAAEGGGGRRQRHGRPDGRPAARAARAGAERGLLDARRQLPRSRAQPDAAREPRVHHARGAAAQGRPRHRLGRRRRPLLLHRRDRATSSTATSSPRCSPSRCSSKEPGGDGPLRRARQPRRGRRRRARRRPRAGQPGRSRLLQDPDARGARDLRRRGLGPLLLPGVLQRRLGHAAGTAHPGAALPARARRCPSCSSPTAASTSSPARSTAPSTISTPRSRRSPSATPTHARAGLDGISIDYDDWHFNVRASNTEPLLRLCLESLVSVPDMEAKRDEVLGLIRS